MFNWERVNEISFHFDQWRMNKTLDRLEKKFHYKIFNGLLMKDFPEIIDQLKWLQKKKLEWSAN